MDSRPPNFDTRAPGQAGGSGGGSRSGVHAPAAGLNQLPEEILCQILAPLLPLKWYSLSTLTALSETSSYLRTFLMQNDTLWHRALLGRAMGRPLHTIPGYAGFAEHDESLRKALEVVKGGGSAKTAMGAGGAAIAASLIGLTTGAGGMGSGTQRTGFAGLGLPDAPGSPTASVDESRESTSAGGVNAKLSKSQKKKLKERAKKQLEKVQEEDPPQGQAGDEEFGSGSGAEGEGAETNQEQAPEGARMEKLPYEGVKNTFDPQLRFPEDGEVLSEEVVASMQPDPSRPGYTMNGYLVPPVPPHISAYVTSRQMSLINPRLSRLPPPTSSTSPSPLRALPPLTFRDLAMRIHSHEQRCVHCKVADSKLSHYYMTDEELRDADKMGVNVNVIEAMSRLCGGRGGGVGNGFGADVGEGNGRRMWGEGKFLPAKLVSIMTPKEASTKAVRTAKFFVGYDFFGFCQYTLAIRIKNKSEPLTQPALARIEVIVFVPAKTTITITHVGVQLPPQEVARVGAFVVGNWGGITLGDFQVGFERWVNEPMSPEELKLFETKCGNIRAKGKLYTRQAFIPSTYNRFRIDESQRLYEIGDIRPLGNRVEGGRAAILLGDRSASR